MMGCLEGKVAIVTGGGRGIGREECLLLAAEGASVVVNDLGGQMDGSGFDELPAAQVVRMIESSGGRAIASYEDVRNFEAAKRIIDGALVKFGRLDALVNNAGILRDRMLYNMSEEEFDSVVAVHLKGHFNCARWASAYFREERRAGRESSRHIVNTTSLAGLIGNIGQTNYSAAKAGIAMMTRVWSEELRKFGVRVNAVAPMARTRLTETTFGDLSAEAGKFDAMSPANVAPLVVFLASDLSNEISGEVFGIHGGEVDRQVVWSSARSLSKEGAWTVDELSRRMRDLL